MTAQPSENCTNRRHDLKYASGSLDVTNYTTGRRPLNSHHAARADRDGAPGPGIRGRFTRSGHVSRRRAAAGAAVAVCPERPGRKEATGSGASRHRTRTDSGREPTTIRLSSLGACSAADLIVI